MKTFSEFGLSQPTIASLSKAGFTEPTEVQRQAIGIVMAGQDLMASAQTGSGKTAAYVLPIIERLEKSQLKLTRALVLVPTRELALQVKEQFERFGRHLRTIAIYGGTSYHRQIHALGRGVDVIVATPGRLVDLLQRQVANLQAIQTLVLDEVDRLMDMGFMPQIRKVLVHIPAKRQTLMFSATIDKRVEQIAAEFLIDPTIIRCRAQEVDAGSIEQKIHYLHEFAKVDFLLQLLAGLDETSVLVFTQTRRKASWVTDRLQAANVRAEEIHGSLSQHQREKIMARYRKGDFAVLVATDIAARGLDVPQIGHVVNYDLPMSAHDYVHRIGRTGRAGRSGVAHTFVCEGQGYILRDIERIIGCKFEDRPPGVVGLAKIGSRRFTPRRRR